MGGKVRPRGRAGCLCVSSSGTLCLLNSCPPRAQVLPARIAQSACAPISAQNTSQLFTPVTLPPLAFGPESCSAFCPSYPSHTPSTLPQVLRLLPLMTPQYATQTHSHIHTGATTPSPPGPPPARCAAGGGSLRPRRPVHTHAEVRGGNQDLLLPLPQVGARRRVWSWVSHFNRSGFCMYIYSHYHRWGQRTATGLVLGFTSRCCFLPCTSMCCHAKR